MEIFHRTLQLRRGALVDDIQLEIGPITKLKSGDISCRVNLPDIVGEDKVAYGIDEIQAFMNACRLVRKSILGVNEGWKDSKVYWIEEDDLGGLEI